MIIELIRHVARTELGDPSAKAVLKCLAEHTPQADGLVRLPRNEQGDELPALVVLCAETELGYHTARRALVRLIAAGYVLETNGKGRPRRYQINMKKFPILKITQLPNRKEKEKEHDKEIETRNRARA